MKVTVHQGITLPIPGKGGFSSAKYDVTIADIDTEEDTKAQIERSLAVVNEITEAGEMAVADGMANLTGMNFEGLVITEEFNKFVTSLKTWQDSIVKEIRRQKEIVDGLVSVRTEG